MNRIQIAFIDKSNGTDFHQATFYSEIHTLLEEHALKMIAKHKHKTVSICWCFARFSGLKSIVLKTQHSKSISQK